MANWRKYHPAVKYEVKDSWNYVRERLLDPASCQKGQYATVAQVPSKGVNVVACCPRGTYMRDRAGKRVGCFNRQGKRVRSPVAQVILHDKGKFRFRHADIWKALMREQPDARGIRTLAARPTEERAAVGMGAALEGMFGFYYHPAVRKLFGKKEEEAPPPPKKPPEQFLKPRTPRREAEPWTIKVGSG